MNDLERLQSENDALRQQLARNGLNLSAQQQAVAVEMRLDYGGTMEARVRNTQLVEAALLARGNLSDE